MLYMVINDSFLSLKYSPGASACQYSSEIFTAINPQFLLFLSLNFHQFTSADLFPQTTSQVEVLAWIFDYSINFLFADYVLVLVQYRQIFPMEKKNFVYFCENDLTRHLRGGKIQI